MVHFMFDKQQYTTNCDVTILYVCCCVTALSARVPECQKLKT